MARCLETIDVLYGGCLFLCMLFRLCGGLLAYLLLKIVLFFSLGVLKYVVCLCKGCDECCVFVCIVACGPVGARV